MVDNIDPLLGLKFDPNKVPTASDFLSSIKNAQITFPLLSDSSFLYKYEGSGLTIGNALEPTLLIQKNLNTAFSVLDSVPGVSLRGISQESLSGLGTTISAMNDAMGTVQEFTLKTGSLFSTPSYDFESQPLTGALSLGLDAVTHGQKLFLDTLSPLTNVIEFGKGIATFHDTIIPSFKMQDIALRTLEMSPTFLSHIPTTYESNDNKITKKITELEDKISQLVQAQDEITISEFTNKVKILLVAIDSSFGDMFQGAHAVLTNKGNKDRIAQSAESMTRIFDNLPEYLATDTKILDSKKKRRAQEAMAQYLGVQSMPGKEIIHRLISLHRIYHDQFDGIRHRNSSCKNYLEDPILYKSLVLQAEAYLFDLLKRGSV